MQLALLVGQKVLMMLVMMLLGVAALRCGLVDSHQSKGLSTVLLYILSPAMVFNAFQIPYSAQKLQGLAVASLYAGIAHLLFILFARLALRRPGARTRVEKAALIYSNAGFITIPLIQATMGQEAVFYSTGYLTISTCLLWTNGLVLVSGDHSNIQLRKIFTNPNLLAIAAGLVCFVTGWRLPVVLQDVSDSMGAAVSSVAMLQIGTVLGGVALGRLLANPRIYGICALRLVVLPLLLIGLFKIPGLMALAPDAKQLMTIVLMAASAPTASAVTMFAQLYDREPDYASGLTVGSTILCILTLPVMVGVGQMVL